MITREVTDTLWAVRCVWLRYFAVFRKSLFYYVVTTFTEPILYLLSFGIGIGSLVGNLTIFSHSISYRSFVFSGIVAQTLLFQGFFEGAYGGFVRMYYQKIFQSMANTPITLLEVLWGELLWDASKATVAAEVVLFIGFLSGDFPFMSLLTLLPFNFFCALLFSGLGLLAAALSKNIEALSYPQYLLVFPMFLFCGVFYPTNQLPEALQIFSWVFPLTEVLAIVRGFIFGFPIALQTWPIVIFYLVLFPWLAIKMMKKRLIK